MLCGLTHDLHNTLTEFQYFEHSSSPLTLTPNNLRSDGGYTGFTRFDPGAKPILARDGHS